jgi:hypothetical protein
LKFAENFSKIFDFLVYYKKPKLDSMQVDRKNENHLKMNLVREETNIGHLPNENLVQIFSHLNHLDLVKIEPVCRNWKQLTHLFKYDLKNESKYIVRFNVNRNNQLSKILTSDSPKKGYIAISDDQNIIGCLTNGNPHQSLVSLFKIPTNKHKSPSFKFDHDIVFLGFQNDNFMCLGKKGFSVFDTKRRELEVASDYHHCKNEVLFFQDDNKKNIAYFFQGTYQVKIYNNKKIQTINISFPKNYKCIGLSLNENQLNIIFNKSYPKKKRIYSSKKIEPQGIWQIYDLTTNHLLKKQGGFFDQAPTRILSNNRYTIIQFNQEIAVYDGVNKNQICKIPLDAQQKIEHLKLHGNKIVVVVSSIKDDRGSTQILLWNAKTGDLERQIDDVGPIENIDLDVNILAVAPRDLNAIYFFDLKNVDHNHALILGEDLKDAKLFDYRKKKLGIQIIVKLLIPEPAHCTSLKFKKNDFILLQLATGEVELITKRSLGLLT